MMKPFESYFKSHDHHRLFYQEWKGEMGKAKGVLIFVHGLNEHSGRYSNPVRYFSKRGYTLYLFDQRGHGRSDGLRSHVDSFGHYLKDLDEFTRFVAGREKGKKIFMVGHSMGGQIVLNYVARGGTPLAGFVTSSANIQVALNIPWLKRKLALGLSRFVPRLNLAGEIDPKWISRDPEVVRAYKRDPLVSKKISLKLIAELLANQEKLPALAPKVRIPGLLLHAGDDHICAREGSEAFYKKMGSKDKQVKIYDGFYHELFNEFGKEEVFGDMEKWLARHL
ncbi:MAG: lysophospholipase [Deltaproteobacteria bacterium]|nr:lysophospholipase [Deltaproteobacteria bacterium]